ncbi:hypothetical protein IEQ34_000213 [Dendrobium chrysotoxum]|uniref:Uncharacterized protein n=1 Tax=Dendrobium chrysotoxum TaxID=161865 RepID=A0AAV7H8H2_DENCH|nr:hypothetical protein IEQ34_000213 [Dendrobium chrysotoxum]
MRLPGFVIGRRYMLRIVTPRKEQRCSELEMSSQVHRAMSRCYPFPPPGYEPKTRTGIIDLSTKEKQVEKKHKKEKRDREKRGHKEKRDNKDRIKDKNKEKKDQKHKDRKKEKDRDKGRTSKDRKAEGLSQGHNELHIKESWQKTDEGNDSKFEEELGKRTKDDGAENPMVGSFANSIQRKFEGAGTANASVENSRVAASRVFSVQVGSVQRRNDRSDLPIENFAISLQKEAEYICTEATMEKERSKMHGFISATTGMEKERSKMHGRVVVGRDTMPSRNHGISRSTERVSDLVIRKTGGSTADMEKEKCGERSLVSNSVVPGPDRRKVLGARTLASSSLATAQRRKDVLGMPVENLSSIHGKTEVVSASSLYSRIEGIDTAPTIEKERASGGAIFPHHVVEKDIPQKVEKKNKTQVKKAEDRQGHKDGDHSVQKSKAKDKDRITKEKKKEENIVENAEAIVHNKIRNYGKKDQVDTLNCKPLAPHKDNAIGTECVDGTMKKRKNLDMNGYIKENDERPGKIPKLTSASQSLVNGRLSELHLTAPSSIFLKSGAINNLRPDRLLENKERMINGNAISQHPPLELKPPASGGPTKNSDVSLVLLPHPDSKYLSQIYTVPKMVESPESDDQEWLFNFHDSLQKSKTELKAEKIPQVFAEAMRIDSADILALPYVVPF